MTQSIVTNTFKRNKQDKLSLTILILISFKPKTNKRLT